MTNFVKQKFQWFFDMSTDTAKAQHIQVKAGGPDVYSRMVPFFGAFKHYKLGAVKIRMVPAATLPVDPTGLSYEAGEQTVDPRDIFNPGLVRITNGEDVQLNPNAGYGDNWYYATMLDKRWYKFRLQSGFKRTAKPLFWGVGQLRQDHFPGATTNVPMTTVFEDSPSEFSFSPTPNARYDVREEVLKEDATTEFRPNSYFMSGSSSYGIFQTGEKVRMGWLPTDFVQNQEISSDGKRIAAYGLNNIPTVPLIDIILPKAFKTKFYYRVYVEETVLFKDAVAINPIEALSGGSYKAYQPLDRAIAVTDVEDFPVNSPPNAPSQADYNNGGALGWQ